MIGGFAAGPAEGPCHGHGDVLRLLRRRPRRLRCPRPRGARGHLQRQRRQLPLPQLAAGLLAVFHLDPRAGLGDVRVCRAAGVPGGDRRGDEENRAPAVCEAARATCDFYIDRPRQPTAFPIGTPAPRLAQAGRLASRVRPIRSTATSRSTVRPRRSPRRACCAWAVTRPRAALLAGRPDGAGHAAWTNRT